MKPRLPIRRRLDLRLGPLLLARGVQGDRWRLSCTVLIGGEDEPPDLRVEGVRLAVPPRFLYEWRLDGTVERLWRYDFAVPRAIQDSRAGYGFDGDERRWHVVVPGTAMPPRLAYAACGGCEDEAEIAAAGLSRNARWGHLLGRHRADPYHLLLMGGDQIYADGLWRTIPELAEAARLPLRRRGGMPVPPDLPARLDRFFLDTYRYTWAQPEMAAVMASLPIFCMWDDHDIIDGWGSHPAEQLDSPFYRTLFEAGRRAFLLFQLGMAPDDPAETVWGPAGSLTQGLSFNGLGVLAPDLRSERRPDRILSEASWAALPGWLNRLEDCRHLLIMSSVPLIFTSLSLAERLLNLIPGRQKMEDDLRDQWRSPVHRAEWERMIGHLTRFARERHCRITILSGEVHFGAAGRLRGPGTDIWQFISSGIVHPPPPPLLTDLMERLASRRETPIEGFMLDMPIFAETGRRVLRARNWLSLTITPDGALEGTWHAEAGPTPLRHVLPALT